MISGKISTKQKIKKIEKNSTPYSPSGFFFPAFVLEVILYIYEIIVIFMYFAGYYLFYAYFKHINGGSSSYIIDSASQLMQWMSILINWN